MQVYFMQVYFMQVSELMPACATRMRWLDFMSQHRVLPVPTIL